MNTTTATNRTTVLGADTATTTTARRNRNRLGLKVLFAGAGVLVAAGAFAPHAGATTPVKPAKPGIDGPVIAQPPVTLPPTTTTTKGKGPRPIDPCKIRVCPEPPLTADPGCGTHCPPPPVDPCNPGRPSRPTGPGDVTARTLTPGRPLAPRPTDCTPPTTKPEPGGSSSSGTARPADVVKANPTFTG